MSDERWDMHFLLLAAAHARMSKDPSTKVGAVIVGPDREIRSVGFNGFPRGIADTEERLGDRDTKLKLIVHGEMNAILAAARVGIPLKGCTMYVAATDKTGVMWGGPPCIRCTVEVTDGTKNACSFLLSRCARAAFELGYMGIQTYTRADEDGASLRAARLGLCRQGQGQKLEWKT